MSEPRNQGLPPGYSADDVVDVGAQPNTAPQNSSLPPGYSAGDIVDVPGASMAGADPSMGGTLHRLKDYAIGLGKGAAKGVIDTVSHGAAGAYAEGTGEQVQPGEVEHAMGEIKNTTLAPKPNTMQETGVGHGYAGETMLELYGIQKAAGTLINPDTVLAAGRAMKILQANPKIAGLLGKGAAMQQIEGFMTKVAGWLEMGATANKVKSALTKADTDLLAAHPYLARLVAAGFEDASFGTAVGTHTLLRTGDPATAGRDALTAAGLGAPLVAAHAVGSGYLAEAGNAKPTINKLNRVAKSAPEAASHAHDLADTIDSAQANVEVPYKAADAMASQDLTLAKSRASTQQETALAAADATRKGEEAAAAGQLEHSKLAGHEGARQIEADAATTAESAKKGLLGTLERLSDGAPDAAETAPKVRDLMKDANKQSHADFETGISGEHGIETRLEGHTIDLATSPVAEEAAAALRAPVPEDHPLVGMAKEALGDMLTPKVKGILEAASKGEAVVEADGKKTTVAMRAMTVHDLVQLRQAWRSLAEANYGTVSGRALYRMLPAVDATIEKMAAAAGDTSVSADYAALRAAYKQRRGWLGSDTAERLTFNDREPDKALDDVGKYLLGGNNAIGKIKTLRGAASITGEDTVQAVAKTQVGQWRKLAEDDPAKFLRTWESGTPGSKAARRELLGDDAYQKLDQAVQQYREQMANSARTSAAADNVRKAYDQSATKVSKQATDAAKVNYDAASKAAQDAYDSYVGWHTQTMPQNSRQAALAPFKNSFIDSLRSGKMTQAMATGKVDVHDIRAAKQIIGPEKWGDWADGLFGTMVTRSVDRFGRPDPEKLADLLKEMKSSTFEEIFADTASRPDRLVKLREFQKEIEQAGSAKAKNKLALHLGAAGTTSILGGAGAHFAGANAMGHVYSMILSGGGELGLQGMSSFAREVLNSAANNPKLWSFLAVANKAAQSRVAGGAKRAAYAYAGTALGSTEKPVDAAVSYDGSTDTTASGVGKEAP